MSLIQEILGRNFAGSGAELRIGGIEISRIAKQFGTPVFIYDQAILRRQLKNLRAALPSRFDVFYSIKANPNPSILRFFIAAGCGLEIASGGELSHALAAGCPANRIIFAGPGKTEAELEYAINAGIGELHVESLTELRRISRICQKLGRRADIGLRVNPTGDAEGGAMRMGGKPAQFGIDEEELDSVIDIVQTLREVELVGIHLFAGTQILEAETLAAQYRKGLEVASRVGRKIGRPLNTLDFGGGLGIPYFANEVSLDLNRLTSLLKELFGEFEGDPFLRGTRFVAEPGRFLVAESGIYVTAVNDVKVSRGKKFVILDGGMNHHLAASGNLGQTIKRNFPIAVLNKLDAPEEEAVDIVGPLCTPLDTLGRAVKMPRIEVGDLIGIFQSGAYARTSSPSEFLSHPSAAEIMIAGGEAISIRNRGAYEDMIRKSEAVSAGRCIR